MKTKAYCYARCNREKRRACKQDCRKLDVEKDNIERSLVDIETFYLATHKISRHFNWRRSISEFVRKNNEASPGRDAIKLWMVALERDGMTEVPPSWRIPGGEYLSWDPRVMYMPHWSDASYWEYDKKWFHENKDKAIEGGLDSMLDAYYAGVPYEDIVA